MKSFFTVLAFCAIIAAFGIMIVGAYLEKGQMWVNMFALFFTIGALSFWAWLSLENKENNEAI